MWNIPGANFLMFRVVGWRQFGYKIAPMLEHPKRQRPCCRLSKNWPRLSQSLAMERWLGFVVFSAFYACAAAFFLLSSRISRFSKKADRWPFSTRRSNSSSKSDLTEKLMLMCLFSSGWFPCIWYLLLELQPVPHRRTLINAAFGIC